MTEECHICCEKFNKSNHKNIDCGFCDLNCCRTCVQSYLLSTSNDAHCMKCKHEWNREFIFAGCTKTFCNKEYKNHREVILFEREKCLLPETQPLVVQERKRRETIQTIRTLKDEIAARRQHLHELEEMLWNNNFGVDTSTKQKFVRKCPFEGCKGFLNTSWKCDICENWTCPHCNEVKGKRRDCDHECDPNNVETVKLLKSDTRPCPNCGTMIFKISGCSQMWCPDCHTAFDWRTGNIETGVIHNPHFYEFQRRTGGRTTNRVAGDIPCGGMPTVRELYDYLNIPVRNANNPFYRQINADVPIEYEKLFEIHRFINHVERYEIAHNYRANPVNNAELRVKYLMNELDDEKFKKMIQQREKAYNKARNIRDVLQMFVHTSSDMYRQMVLDEVTVEETQVLLDALIDYCNTTFVTIGKRYNSRIISIRRAHNYYRVD